MLNFYHGLTSDATLPLDTKNVLWLLFRLFALHTMNKSCRDFVQSGAMTNDQADQIADTAIIALMATIRPHAVKLVDSWKFPDYLLDRYSRSTSKLHVCS